MKGIGASLVLLPVLALTLSNCGNQNSPAALSVNAGNTRTLGEASVPLGTASQSSTYLNASASLAIDGDTNGNYFNGSVAHTNNDLNAWWKVTFDTWYSIDSVVIWNRTDCSPERLSNFDIQTSMSSGNDDNNWHDEWYMSDQCPEKNAFSYTYSKSWNNNLKPVGNCVRIRLRGTNYLALAEVKVYGVKAVQHGAKSLVIYTSPEVWSLAGASYIFGQKIVSSAFTYPYVRDYGYKSKDIALTGNSSGLKIWILEDRDNSGSYTLESKPYPNGTSWTQYPFTTKFKMMKAGVDGYDPYLLGTDGKVYRYKNGFQTVVSLSNDVVQDFCATTTTIFYLSTPVSSDGNYTVYKKTLSTGTVTTYGGGKPIAQTIAVDPENLMNVYIANGASSKNVFRCSPNTVTLWNNNESGRIYRMYTSTYTSFGIYVLTEPIIDGGYTVKKCPLTMPMAWKALPAVYY